MLTFADLCATGYLLWVLLRMPQGKVPHIFIWYFAVVLLGDIYAGIGFPDYRITLVPILILSVLAMSSVSSHPTTLGGIALGVAAYFTLRPFTKTGIWPLESGTLIACGTVMMLALAHDRGVVTNLLTLYTGLIFLARGWVMYFGAIGAVRYEFFTRRNYPWVLVLSSILLTLLLIRSLRSQMEGTREVSHLWENAVSSSHALACPTPEPTLARENLICAPYERSPSRHRP